MERKKQVKPSAEYIIEKAKRNLKNINIVRSQIRPIDHIFTFCGYNYSTFQPPITYSTNQHLITT